MKRLLILLILLSQMVYSQESDKIILADSYETLTVELKEIEDKTSIKKLTIIVKENYAGWTVFGFMNNRYHYDSPSNYYAKKIKGLPPVLVEFANLEHLDISHLGLEKLDPFIADLQHLRTLNISYNDLEVEKLLPVLEQMSNLNTLIAINTAVSKYTLIALKDLSNVPTLIYKLSDAYRMHDELDGWKYSVIGIEEDDQTLIALLNVIHEYYPIGLTSIRYAYPGKKKIDSIHKISQQDRNSNDSEHKWSLLFERIRALEGAAYNAHNYANNSISFSIIIPLKTEKDGVLIEEKKSVQVHLSLLANYYTIFLKSEVLFKHYNEYSNYKLRTNIIYGKQNASVNENKLIEKISQSISQLYPSYEFVDHYLLLKNKIKGGIPIGEYEEEIQDEYPIFNYLFDPISYVDIKIIE
ncbi:MAG: hypothetical protein WBA74_20400 [Cyclobacteriaceae bacterium]